MQVHDFNPGITDAGFFWTIAAPASSVRIDRAAGTALLTVKDLSIHDYFTFENSIVGDKSNRVAGSLSFTISWQAVGATRTVDNPAQRFRGTFRDAEAHIAWSGRSGDHDFASGPLSASFTDGAEIGEERNGSFY